MEISNNSSLSRAPISPIIAELPPLVNKRLIDFGMLHLEASLAGFGERYKRGETSHTIHVWWARRPHTAMRALVFASICKEYSKESFENSKLLLSSKPNYHAVKRSQVYLRSQYDSTPRLLDMFGGGTIGFESRLLGVETYSIDVNELSVFIQKSNFEYSNVLEDLHLDQVLLKSGMRVLEKLKCDTEWLYPLREKYNDLAFGYIWSYSRKCDNCGYRYLLMKRPWLSKKKGKSQAFVLTEGDRSQETRISDVDKDYKFSTSWLNRSGQIKCPKCGIISRNIDVRACEDELMSVIISNPRNGKSFIATPKHSIPASEEILRLEEKLLDEMNVSLPGSKLPKWSGIVNPSLYGIETHSDFLNPRQRLLLLYLIRSLREEYSLLEGNYGKDLSKWVIANLSGLIDQLVDWNCRLSMWIPQNEQVGRAFSGPGIAMYWDYVETDPLLRGPSNLWDKLKRIADGAKFTATKGGSISIQKAAAQKLPFEDAFFDAIVTDPPYYDNIFYSALADFFYSWKRLLFSRIEPGLFEKESTESDSELVAASFRSTTEEETHKKYCLELEKAFNEAARVLKRDGVFSFIYSHSSLNAWDAIVHAYRSSPFIVTSAQPLSIERKQRPRAMTSEAVNTCIVFVARKAEASKPKKTLESIIESVSEIIVKFSIPLMKLGWDENDAALAAFANGVGLVANSSEVLNVVDTKDALMKIADEIKKTMPKFFMRSRKVL